MRPLSVIARALLACTRRHGSPREYFRVALCNSPGTYKAFGFDVLAPDSNAFAYLYEEIAIYESYAFEARTDQPTIVDCGANIGLSTLWFKNRYPRAHILAFEPNPEAADVLDDALRRNDIDGVEVHRVALGVRRAFFRFTPLSAIELAPPRPSTPATIRALTRWPGSKCDDSRTSFPQVDLLKLDVEGSEDAVLTELDAAGALRSMYSRDHRIRTR